MGGFPTRPNRASFGPTYVNERPIANREKELDATKANLLCWQGAGASQAVPKAWILASVDSSGETVSISSSGLAYDPDRASTPPSLSYEGSGLYSFSFEQQYPDENGTDVNLGLVGGLVSAANAAGAAGEHTGSDGASTLTDSSLSLSTDELVGMTIYNATDGSSGTITGNTENTISATLSGGSDNDWDNGDAYIVLPGSANGHVHLDTGHSGYVSFVDSSGDLVDVTLFMLVLW
jgi:hypothetical protein